MPASNLYVKPDSHYKTNFLTLRYTSLDQFDFCLFLKKKNKTNLKMCNIWNTKSSLSFASFYCKNYLEWHNWHYKTLFKEHDNWSVYSYLEFKETNIKLVEYKEKQKFRYTASQSLSIIKTLRDCLEVNIYSGNLPPWKYFEQIRQWGESASAQTRFMTPEGWTNWMHFLICCSLINYTINIKFIHRTRTVGHNAHHDHRPRFCITGVFFQIF